MEGREVREGRQGDKGADGGEREVSKQGRGVVGLREIHTIIYKMLLTLSWLCGRAGRGKSSNPCAVHSPRDNRCI